jgi:hypothetical protein
MANIFYHDARKIQFLCFLIHILFISFRWVIEKTEV